MEKIDLRKSLKYLYNPKPGKPELLEVPPLTYAMVDGQGDPNTSSGFQDVIGALYGIAFTAKFALKKADPPMDFTIMALEGLYRTAGTSQFDMYKKDEWGWTLMMLLPDIVTPEVFEDARRQLMAKKPSPAVELLRLETLVEGLSAQVMHVGPYSAEEPTISALHAFIAETGYEPSGQHHEIYMGDPRRAKPEALKTIIRQPVKLANPPTKQSSVKAVNPALRRSTDEKVGGGGSGRGFGMVHRRRSRQ